MSAFRTLTEATVRWRPASGDGLEHLTIRPENGSIVARSVVIGARGGGSYGVHYRIVCDAAWRVRSLDLETTTGQRLRLSSVANGEWADGDGNRLTDFNGCIDIDLAGTPFTNTLPIRRLELKPEDGPVELSMLYVPFDTFAPVIDRQRYRCLETARVFRYEAADRSFAADLPIDERGLVIDYPSLFKRI